MLLLHTFSKKGVHRAFYTPYKAKYDIISITPIGENKILKDYIMSKSELQTTVGQIIGYARVSTNS